MVKIVMIEAEENSELIQDVINVPGLFILKILCNPLISRPV